MKAVAIFAAVLALIVSGALVPCVPLTLFGSSSPIQGVLMDFIEGNMTYSKSRLR